MRLLHTTHYTFKDFLSEEDTPPYVIISHRWTNQEVTHQDFLLHRERFLRGECAGYGWRKIEMACRLAAEGAPRQEPFEWVWIDTVCIDKKNNTELSEAINSMFAWYRNAEVCYAFLCDVTEIDEDGSLDEDVDEFEGDKASSKNSSDNSPSEQDSRAGTIRPDGAETPFHLDEFMSSSWFTRSWTLQELLAPSAVAFFNANFLHIGTRDNLNAVISRITDIPERQLSQPFDPGFGATIAARFRWASKRHASRVEDISYSLLGLFDVHMPLLYGEGMKAFARLQKEIISRSEDESIFAWPANPDPTRGSGRRGEGVLARHPWQFRNVESYVSLPLVPRQHYDMTNKGLRLLINMPESLLPHDEDGTHKTEPVVLLPLNLFLQYQLAVSDFARGKTRVPCLRLLIRRQWSWGAHYPRAKSFEGVRLGLELIEIPGLAGFYVLEKAARTFQKDVGREWDAIAGINGPGYVEVAVYLKLGERGLKARM